MESSTADDRELIYQKQLIKERDGFCRRVDTYDGQVVCVDQKPTYELGNYLGGGVAGVVYEGHRLRPMEEYPVRTGQEPTPVELPPAPEAETGTNFFCGPVDFVQSGPEDENDPANDLQNSNVGVKDDSRGQEKSSSTSRQRKHEEEADMAIEATVSADAHGVLLDAQDAPSRSKHFARAASVAINPKKGTKNRPLRHGLSDETVAVKILNPVGFRILPPDGLKGSVVVRKGEPMSDEVRKGTRPMQEKHVWWLVNPNSRNLRTLQRYSGKDSNGAARGVQVDRGSAEKGLRLSLIAAYIDPRTDLLRELTLTRCIEIWGHVPFSASDVEFENMMTAIERVNAGKPPPPFPAFASDDGENPPSRIGTGGTEATQSMTSQSTSVGDGLDPIALEAQRT